MKVHHFTPFSVEKNLGKAYNQCFEIVGEDDWVCLRDCDTLFLLPDTPTRIYEYVKRNQDVGLLTSYCNRIHHTSDQLFGGKINEDTNILNHIKIARDVEKDGYETLELTKNVSGFLMVISKKTWREMPFPESGQCLGIDTSYWQRLVTAKKKIYLMKSIYVWHTYRIENGITNKTHLL